MMNWIAKIGIGWFVALPVSAFALTGLAHNTFTTNGGAHLTLPRSEGGQSDKLGLKRPGAEDKHKADSQPTELDKRSVDRRLLDRRTANDDESVITFGKKPRHGGRM
jgi:hypothetical protein